MYQKVQLINIMIIIKKIEKIKIKRIIHINTELQNLKCQNLNHRAPKINTKHK